ASGTAGSSAAYAVTATTSGRRPLRAPGVSRIRGGPPPLRTATPPWLGATGRAESGSVHRVPSPRAQVLPAGGAAAPSGTTTKTSPSVHASTCASWVSTVHGPDSTRTSGAPPVGSAPIEV